MFDGDFKVRVESAQCVDGVPGLAGRLASRETLKMRGRYVNC
jgi:hypothetical protein